MDACLLGGDGQHLRAGPGERVEIGVSEIVGTQGGRAGGVDFTPSIGDVEAENPGRSEQAVGVIAQAENISIIAVFALEHCAGIMQATG